jgi:hypothetical protein
MNIAFYVAIAVVLLPMTTVALVAAVCGVKGFKS